MTEMEKAVGEFASNKFMNAAQQNTMSLTILRSVVGKAPKVNVIPLVDHAQELLSHTADPGPSRTDTPLFATIQRAIVHAHPEAKVMPVSVPWGTDHQKFR